MNIAQKLQAIADNQPKVYEAGGRKQQARIDKCLEDCIKVTSKHGYTGICNTVEELPEHVDGACDYTERQGEDIGRFEVFGYQDTALQEIFEIDVNEFLPEEGAEEDTPEGRAIARLNAVWTSAREWTWYELNTALDELGLDGQLNDEDNVIPDAVNIAYDGGKQAQHDAFWDAFQQSGARTSYAYAFASWELQYFRPKYDLVPRNATYMFREFSWLADLQPVDLEELLGNCDIRLDFSNCTSWDAAFFYSGISRLGVVDMSAYTTGYRFFSGCGELVTIDELILNGDTNYNWDQAFNGCRKLENLTISGVLPAGQYNQIKFGDCTKLTHDSLLSILAALKDYSEDTSGTTRTIQLGSTNRNKLTSDELAIATNKGWTVT